MTKEDIDELLNADLHEVIEITELCYAFRVFGGVIYKFYNLNDSEQLVLASTEFVKF